MNLPRVWYFCKMRVLLLLCAAAVFTSASAQLENPQTQGWELGNTYRSPANPLYWKNKKPFEGYWQQDVYYRISAYLDDSAEVIQGTEVLVYYNNSPNVLTEAYFHLYQNAVQPGSLVDELYKENKTPHTFGKYEAQKLGTEITYATVNGAKTQFQITNTVMEVALPAPLMPGDSVQFELHFKTYFDRGSIRRRMKVYDHDGFKHFNGVHWYPRICVYDRKFAWETSQHMEHEFYGDYGAYDVELNLPSEYVNEATGSLLNSDEVYANGLREKLDISNFKERRPNDQPTLVAPKGGRKTWRYHANNVHDFAWTADPTYRIGEVIWNGVQCIALAQEQNAHAWQPTAAFVANVVATYSRDFGMYEYPKMVAADAADGMEYPMITLDGGVYPSHRGLIAHEVGHNWFFGMIGSNETYRAALDEGFTQFLTAWSMKELTNQNQRPSPVEYSTNYFGYLRDAIDGTDPTLNTHSDDFHNAIGHGGGYGHVYYKTATMLYNLEYVLGDSVFLRAMKAYVRQWKMCHPYIEDFRNSITMSAGTDLNWFFDQWFESSKYIDYSVYKVKKQKGTDRWDITLKRKGDMIMPLDLIITQQDGSKLPVTVPVSYYYKPGAIADKPWIGWGNLRQEYTLSLNLPSGIKQVQIDNSGRLADIDLRNNLWKRQRSLKFDRENELSRQHLGGYKLYWRPDFWLTQNSGYRAGVKLSGDYANRKHIFNLYAWSTGGVERIEKGPLRYAWWFDYKHHVRKAGVIELGSRLISNIHLHQAGWRMNAGEGSLYAGLKYMQSIPALGQFLPQQTQLMQANGFLPEQTVWSEGRNISANLVYNRPYRGFHTAGNWELAFRTTTPWSDVQYGFVRFTWKNQLPLGKFDLSTRAIVQAGQGRNQAAESALYASGANPEEYQENKVARDWGTYLLQQSGTGEYLHLGGGLNLRGFNRYGLPHKSGDTIKTFYRGSSGAAINAELDYSRFFARKSSNRMLSLKGYLFGDIGMLGYASGKGSVNSGVLADAGAGFVLSIRNWNLLAPKKMRPSMTALAPLNIRFDMPFFVSAVQPGDEYLQFRWMLGINRAF